MESYDSLSKGIRHITKESELKVCRDFGKTDALNNSPCFTSRLWTDEQKAAYREGYNEMKLKYPD